MTFTNNSMILITQITGRCFVIQAIFKTLLQYPLYQQNFMYE